jgi:hypothetical protein
MRREPIPTPLPLLIRHAQWIVVGTVIAVMWDAAQPAGSERPAFYPDQVLRVRVGVTLKDTRSPWRRLWERGTVQVHKPYNARRLAPGDGEIFFLTRNAVPAQGGAPYDLTARQTGYLEVGLSQPYRVGGLYPPWVSNGLDEPLPLARIEDVQAALRIELNKLK